MLDEPTWKKRGCGTGILGWLAATVAAAGLSVALGTTPAHAIGPQIATNQGSSSLCMNRAGAGTGAGTAVIAYNCGDQHNDFEFISPHKMCGSGFVTQDCPFDVGSSMNSALAGDQIVYEYSYNTGLCLGSTNRTDVTAKLTTCPDIYGSGGWNTIYIAHPIDVIGGIVYYALINRNWSDLNYEAQGGGCHGVACLLNLSVSYPVGYRNPLAINAANSHIQSGDWQNLQGDNQWGEV